MIIAAVVAPRSWDIGRPDRHLVRHVLHKICSCPRSKLSRGRQALKPSLVAVSWREEVCVMVAVPFAILVVRIAFLSVVK